MVLTTNFIDQEEFSNILERAKNGKTKTEYYGGDITRGAYLKLHDDKETNVYRLVGDEKRIFGGIRLTQDQVKSFLEVESGLAEKRYSLKDMDFLLKIRLEVNVLKETKGHAMVFDTITSKAILASKELLSELLE